MHSEKVYLFNKAIDKLIFVTSLIILIILSSFLRVYYCVQINPEIQLTNERSI